MCAPGPGFIRSTQRFVGIVPLVFHSLTSSWAAGSTALPPH